MTNGMLSVRNVVKLDETIPSPKLMRTEKKRKLRKHKTIQTATPKRIPGFQVKTKCNFLTGTRIEQIEILCNNLMKIYTKQTAHSATKMLHNKCNQTRAKTRRRTSDSK